MDTQFYRIWKKSWENNWWPDVALIALALGFFLVSCTNSAIEPEGEEGYPAQSNQLQTPSLPQATLSVAPTSSMSTPDRILTTIPVLTSTPEPSPTTTPIVETVTSTATPTATPSLTPTPVILPKLLVVVIEVRKKGEADEFHEIWMVDTSIGEKWLVFTTTAGTRLTRTMWGGEQSDNLYVTEIKGIGEGHITWQLYEVNYQTGDSRAFFEEALEGLPRLRDTSTQGKWLRVLVEYPISQAPNETWFMNTEDNSLIKTDQYEHYFFGFVWSPLEPDIFAYFRQATINNDRQVPQSIVISEVTNFEILDTIDYRYTSFRSRPLLMWDLSTPKEIMFLSPGETYMIDLAERQWKQVAQNLDVFPGDGHTRLVKSPSGRWAVTTTFIRVIELNAAPKVVERLEDRIGQRVGFLSWYNDQDWIVIATPDGTVQIYELGGNFDLLREINLIDYGFTSPGSHTILAKRLE